MKSIERFTTLLECTSEEAWRNSIFQLGNEYGFDQTLIAVVSGRPTSLGDAFLCSNYSSRWLGIYDSSQLLNIDPTVAHCVTRSTPLIWEPAVFARKQQKEMYEEACSHGLRSGISLPFHGPGGEIGILCFVNDTEPSKRFQRDALHAMPALSMLRDFAFESSLRYAKLGNQESQPALTRRELECLKWCASGKTSWEISQILRCSESAINFHFGNLRRKFNATSRRQVVVKAIHYGLLRPL
ncbi:MAG: LuxR family transcriptional regulator [Sideroxydans sp.]|nr:LuxR family transcriptional regulator [Sideroxydans sp.]